MRFGIATTEIVPPFPTAMQGYAARRDFFDGVHDPLTFTALIIEAGGSRMMLGAADLGNFPSDGRSQALQQRLAERLGCPAGHVMLNASHTHGGPRISIRAGDDGERPAVTEATSRYFSWLEEQILATTDHALAELRPGSLSYTEGITRETMNRRLERNGLIENAPNPTGEVDDRLQMLVFKEDSGKVNAVCMRMSCHPVATGPQHLLTADFVGAWRTAFRDAFGPDVTPIFLQGAAGDIRPRAAADGETWRKLSHAELAPMGRMLLAETIQGLLHEPWQPLDDLQPTGRVEQVTVPCEPRYTRREQFEALLAEAESGAEYDPRWLDVEMFMQRNYARRCIDSLDAGKSIVQEGTFHVQTLWLNDELALVGLDCEPLVGLGRKIEEQLAPHRTMLLGYTNGCVCYAPDAHELARGGYEALAHLAESWSGPVTRPLEEAFAEALYRPTS